MASENILMNPSTELTSQCSMAPMKHIKRPQKYTSQKTNHPAGIDRTQLIMLYHQQVSDYSAQLAACLAATPLTSEQTQQVERLAHQLRGESLSMGADQLAELAKQLEKLAETQHATSKQFDDAFCALRLAAAHTYAALERWCRDHLSG